MSPKNLNTFWRRIHLTQITTAVLDFEILNVIDTT